MFQITEMWVFLFDYKLLNYYIYKESIFYGKNTTLWHKVSNND